jgi:hypothetical protein
MALLALPVTELHPAEAGKLLTVDRTKTLTRTVFCGKA